MAVPFLVPAGAAPAADVPAPAAAVAAAPGVAAGRDAGVADWPGGVAAGGTETPPAAAGGGVAGELEKLRDSASPKGEPLQPARPGSNSSARTQAPRRWDGRPGSGAVGGWGLLNCLLV